MQPIRSRSENPLPGPDLEPELVGLAKLPPQLSVASIMTPLLLRLLRSALKPPRESVYAIALGFARQTN